VTIGGHLRLLWPADRPVGVYRVGKRSLQSSRSSMTSTASYVQMSTVYAVDVIDEDFATIECLHGIRCRQVEPRVITIAGTRL